MKNGEIWLDIDGKPIHAHGGCRLRVGDKIYWYGEDRREDGYVSCYVSLDEGKSWKFCNRILTVNSPVRATRVRAELALTNEKGGKVNLERPKVLYNRKTKKFVLWAHYENGMDYNEARAAVASSDTPDGDFVYHGSFRPFGETSRDCTLFEDGDKAYFISAGRYNADLHFYLLSEDYLNVSRLVNRAFSNEYREAPALFKRNGKYLLVTSGCTGWRANQAKYALADEIEGVWSDTRDLGDQTTFGSQSAFLYENEKGELVFFGDRWGGNEFLQTGAFDYGRSGYVAYQIEWTEQGATLVFSEEAFFDDE